MIQCDNEENISALSHYSLIQNSLIITRHILHK